MFILDLLLSPRELSPLLVNKMLGFFFLMLAGLIGSFFLFQALVPVVGYLESGAIICIVLVVLGTGFLFIGQKKKAVSQEEGAQKALSFFKDFDFEKILKNNALTVSLLSFGVGIVLSQFKKVKSLSEIYKILK